MKASFALCFSICFLLSYPAEAQLSEDAKRRLKAWDVLIQEHHKAKENDKLALVNHFFNQWQYESDSVVWGKKDYWATPREFVVVGKGDCEDFAIAKYESLRELGITENKLFVCYTKIKRENKKTFEPHMIMAYQSTPHDSLEILDNFNPDIIRADKRPDLKNFYCFNDLGFWEIDKSGKKRYIGKSSDIVMWQDMLKRKDSAKGRQLQEGN